GFDADLRQVADCFGHDLARRDYPWPAAGVDLDADHVFGAEKPPPGIDRLRVSGQRAHPALHHLANDLAVDLQPVFAHTFRGFHRDDLAGIRAGDAGSAGGFVGRDDLIFWNIR